MEGSLQEVGLLKVLAGVAAQRTSGILSVQGEDDIIAVSFLQGAVVGADSLDQAQEVSLGASLEQRDLINKVDYDAVVEEQQNTGGNLIEMLVDRGLVSREEILESLRAITFQLMLQLITWKTGDFKFYGGDEISYEDGFKPVSVEELLIRSVDELPGGGLSGPVPELDAVYRVVPPRSQIQVIAQDGDGLADGLWISAEQADMLRHIDGKSQVLSLVRKMRLGRYQAQFHLYRLLSMDLIELVSQGSGPGVAAAGVATGSIPALGSQGGSAAPANTGALPQMGSSTGSMPAMQPVTAEPSQAHLRAEIFQPPDPSAAAADIVDFETPTPQVNPLDNILRHAAGPVLAIVFLIGLVLALNQRPSSFLLPFPWQENQQGTVERQLRYSLFMKIDRATRAYVLSHEGYPNSLQDLVDAGLLAAADLKDPAGYELSYSSDAVSYRVDLLENGQVVDGLGTSATMTGDFLLDDRMLNSEGDSENPLVLLSN